jgi:hypothetical protein
VDVDDLFQVGRQSRKKGEMVFYYFSMKFFKKHKPFKNQLFIDHAV